MYFYFIYGRHYWETEHHKTIIRRFSVSIYRPEQTVKVTQGHRQ